VGVAPEAKGWQFDKQGRHPVAKNSACRSAGQCDLLAEQEALAEKALKGERRYAFFVVLKNLRKYSPILC